jgi:hypothetical protein
MPDGQIRLTRTERLRNQAALMRRAASVPTSGGHNENRMLLAAAARLEKQAVELEEAAGELFPSAKG